MERTAISLKLEADLSLAFDDGPAFPGGELPARLRARLPGANAVFVDFADGIPWSSVIATVDTVRGVAGDVDGTALPIAVRMHGD